MDTAAVARFPKIGYIPKVYFYPKIDIDSLSDQIFQEQKNLIKYLARLNQSNVPGCDYWNLVGEGALAFATAVSAWKYPENPDGFRKYLKTSIYNKFFHVARYKRTVAANVKEEEYSCSSPLFTTDGGFDNIRYNELTKHVMSNLNGKAQKRIFRLLVDPPESIMKWALVDHRRKLKKSLITGRKVKGATTFRFSEKHVFEYLRETENMDASRFNSILFAIREQVKEMVKAGDFANQTFGF
jgi:hypothetical protein